MKTNSIKQNIQLHLLRYPAMEIGDMLKLIYQSEFGGGHLIENTQLSYEQILEELKDIPSKTDKTCEALSDRICRVYLDGMLSLFPDKNLVAGIVNALFVESAALFNGTMEGYYEKLDLLLHMIEHKDWPDDYSNNDGKSWATDYPFSLKYIADHKNAGSPMLRHSEIYRAAYRPAYRLALSEFVEYLALFKKIEDMRKEKERIIIAIDGKCGSGKSTLARILSAVYTCPAIRVDDFFLPGDLRSEERLNAPGGNVHYERFMEEIIEPLNQGKINFSHKVFDCHTMAYTDTPKEISFSNIAVVEGSYSMQPEFREAYDISVFLDTSPDIQKARIISRGGEMVYEMFESKWIPMENRYFEHFNISGNCDIVFKAI